MDDQEAKRETLKCPNMSCWVSVRLVDESGDGQPFAGLEFTLHTGHGETTSGVLDSEGYFRRDGLHCGPNVLALSSAARFFSDPWYEQLTLRDATRFLFPPFRSPLNKPLPAPEKPTD